MNIETLRTVGEFQPNPLPLRAFVGVCVRACVLATESYAYNGVLSLILDKYEFRTMTSHERRYHAKLV